MEIKPFRLKLKKISSKEQRTLEALFDFLPLTGMREKFHAAIEEALTGQLNMDISYRLESVSDESFGSFCSKLPDQGVYVVLGMVPREGRIIVDVDASLAALFIERLLGSVSETWPAPKPLSEIEQGVFQYLVLQVLSHIYRLCNEDKRVHFRFEKFAFSPKVLSQTIGPDDTVFVLTAMITAGKHESFVRLVFPSPLIEQMYLKVEAKGEIREAERAHMMEKLAEYGALTVPLWAEGGGTIVTAKDMESLEAGDVIVLDNTALSIDEKGLSGRATIRVGDGKHGGFITDISADSKKIHCKIVDVCKGSTHL